MSYKSVKMLTSSDDPKFCFWEEVMLIIQNILEKFGFVSVKENFIECTFKEGLIQELLYKEDLYEEDSFWMLWYNMCHTMFQHVWYNIWSPSSRHMLLLAATSGLLQQIYGIAGSFLSKIHFTS